MDKSTTSVNAEPRQERKIADSYPGVTEIAHDDDFNGNGERVLVLSVAERELIDRLRADGQDGVPEYEDEPIVLTDDQAQRVLCLQMVTRMVPTTEATGLLDLAGWVYDGDRFEAEENLPVHDEVSQADSYAAWMRTFGDPPEGRRPAAYQRVPVTDLKPGDRTPGWEVLAESKPHPVVDSLVRLKVRMTDGNVISMDMDADTEVDRLIVR